jgi:hypothetical protein
VIAVAQRIGPRLAAVLLCNATVAVAFAGPPSVSIGDTNGAHWTQFMLYVGTSVGGGSGAHPMYGFRVEQIRIRANTESPSEAGTAFQHRELMNWQMERGSDFRLQLGRSVTWSATRRAFEPALASAAIVPTLGARDRASADAWRPQSFSLGTTGTGLGTSGSGLSAADAYRPSPSCAEIAAAAASAWSWRQRANSSRANSSDESTRPAVPAMGIAGQGGRRELASLFALRISK